jgi:hypothetical protein
VAIIAERPKDDLAAKVRFRADRREELRRLLDTENIIAFPECLVSDNGISGLFDFLQSYSLGGVRHNTVLLSMPSSGDNKGRRRFLEKVDVIATFDMNLVILNSKDIALNKKIRIIDVWWRGESNGSLMAMFAYVMTLDRIWSGATIRFLRIVKNDKEELEGHRHMSALQKEMRMFAQTKIIRSTDPPGDTIVGTSGTKADLVILGMRATSAEEAKRSLDWLEPLLTRLPTTLLVWSNGEADVFA